jgi:hypothetical protein
VKTFAPLFSTLVNSSVWSESKEVRLLWITMLATKDKNGLVETTIPGLSRAAVLTIEECEAALAILESPDPYSRTPDNNGRRVRRVADGWLVLNHVKYRDMMQSMRNESRKEYKRQWAAMKRKAKKAAQPPTEINK